MTDPLLGRYELEARLRQTERELKNVYDNLTATQIRCSSLLEEKRQVVLALTLLSEIGALECVGETACGDCVRCRAKALIAQ